MKPYKIIYRTVVLCLSVFLMTSCEEEVVFEPLEVSPLSIAEIAAQTSELSALYGALQQANLDSTLQFTKNFTLFAPNNDAFASVDISTLTEDELLNMLLNHVRPVPTAEFARTFPSSAINYASTAAVGPEESPISILINTEDGLSFNGVANAVEGSTDIGATNGIIHIIDGVLTTPTVVDHAVGNPDFSMLVEAVTRVDLADVLNGAGPFTVFVPNNAAFEFFLMQTNEAFGWATIDDIPEEILSQVLLHHVLTGSNTRSDALEGEQTSTIGETYSIAENTINDASSIDANIIFPDIQGINGVVHAIDKVLLPQEIYQSILAKILNLAERAEDRGFSSFLAAVEKAGLTQAFSTEMYTAFTPNNDAFVALFAASSNFSSLDDIDTDEEIAALKSLLEYHLYTGALVASQLTDGGEITTVNGDVFTVDLSGDESRLRPSFTDAIPSTIVADNIGASNGIIHEINRVLIPEALADALGVRSDDGGGVHPITNPELVFFDWDSKVQWWGDVISENEAALSLDGSSYGRINKQIGTDGWFPLFFRNSNDLAPNGGNVVAANLEDYSLKFDINIIEPISEGRITIRFKDADGVDSFYDWAPWKDTGEPFSTDGWETIEIPLTLLGTPDFSLVDEDFGMVFQDADVFLNFAIDNVRFDTPGNPNAGPDPVADLALVFFDWDGKDQWWGDVSAENEAALSLDGGNYGRINKLPGTDGWFPLFFRNSNDLAPNGGNVVADNLDQYSLKFDINVLEPISEGRFTWRFKDADGVDSFYDWAPWKDTGEPFSTDGWVTIKIPLTLLGTPDFSLVDEDFGMVWQDADVLLNFAIDNVRFEQN